MRTEFVSIVNQTLILLYILTIYCLFTMITRRKAQSRIEVKVTFYTFRNIFSFTLLRTNQRGFILYYYIREKAAL